MTLNLTLEWHPSRYQFHTRPVLGITFPKFQLNWSNIQMTLNLTLGDTHLDIIFIPALSSELLSPTFSSIRAIWNLTWPWPWVTHPPWYHFHTRPVLRITFPKFQLNRSNLKFDLTLTPGHQTNINSACLEQSYTHTPSLRSVGPTVSEKSDGQTNIQTNIQTNTQLFI